MEVIRSTPLYQQVYNQLRKEIISGNIDHVSIINEVHLARDLEVSRGPVREAIRILEQEGLLVRDNKNQLKPYKATMEDLENIYQCRQVLESLAAKLAAARMSEEQLDKLESILKKKKTILETETEAEFIDLSSEFHNIIISSSRNPRLQQQINQLRSLSYLYRQKNVKGVKRKEVILQDHETIWKLLKNKDSEKAASFMSEHIERDLNNLVYLYKNGQLG